jgi:phosphoglucomutase
MDTQILERAQKWLSEEYDAETQAEVQKMIDAQSDELVDSFYKDLEFGTGGLRGIMGAGTNRMNKYTVGMATQGLANYLKKEFAQHEQISIAIAYDCRNNNTFFADVTAAVLSGNGMKVYVFDALRPTPELSFAIRQLGCQSGIVITASHNPKEYNGYKVYGEDGGQLVSPNDKMVIDEVRNISSLAEVKFEANPSLIHSIGKELDEAYMQRLLEESLNPEIIQRQKNLKIVYTPIHGTGVHLVPDTLKLFGFESIIGVEEQNVVSGNFPTVHSPNPEEPAALEMAITKAKAEGADLVMATDPDSDRVGIAVRNPQGEFVLLNGNQTASLLFYYILSQNKERGKLQGKEFIVKTIVTSEILIDIAKEFGLEYFDVLTGFKYIAEIIRKEEGKKKFIVGGEESYGYLVGDAVRDKDAVASCCMIAETAAWAADQGKSMYSLLGEIYAHYGFYHESLKSIVRKGKKGADEIQAMMDNYRTNPPSSIAGKDIVEIKDYQLQVHKLVKEGSEKPIDLPKSNVIQFFLEDGSKITMRPSGTEPKIKFYFGVRGNISNPEEMPAAAEKANAYIAEIMKDLGI